MNDANTPAGFATPRALVDHLMARDACSRWLGVEVVDADAGRAVVRMAVRNRDDAIVGHFRGTGYRTQPPHLLTS